MTKQQQQRDFLPYLFFNFFSWIQDLTVIMNSPRQAFQTVARGDSSKRSMTTAASLGGRLSPEVTSGEDGALLDEEMRVSPWACWIELNLH